MYSSYIFGFFLLVITSEATLLPHFLGSVKPASPPITFSAPLCFKSYTAHIDVSGNEAVVSLNVKDPRSFFCHDMLLFLTSKSIHPHLIGIRGAHSVKLHNLNSEEKSYILQNGVQIFSFDDRVTHDVVDLFKLVETIINHKPLALEYSFGFLKKYMNITFEARAQSQIPFREEDIRDGDMLAISAFDAVGLGIMVATGGYTQHSVLLMRNSSGVLHALESTGSEGRSGQFAVPFKQWYPDYLRRFCHSDRHCLISVLPLAPQYRAKFNLAKAWAFFDKVSQQRYGSQALITSFIDTPRDNLLPPLLEPEMLPALFVLLNRIVPASVDVMILQGAAQRLGHPGRNYTLEQVFAECDARNITLNDLLSLPELQKYSYAALNGGPAWLCSSFVMGVYQAAGLFEGFDINFTEFTPRDSYSIAIWDSNYVRPSYCEVGDRLPYCQLFGSYRHVLPGYNSVIPHDRMMENCSSYQVRSSTSC